ncbi:MAG TPA: DUF3179 domain-containing (seleno)protein, partial [Thermoanaerobaculaceae bacterium]|nr:DUF3179 domain-containing (seleno)protein [Thermoanaerobaculaceae bacterium]
EVLPISVETWADWRQEHPDTTVPAPDPRMMERYVSDPYASYVASDLLRFPVAPLPASSALPPKTPVVALGGPGGWTAFPFPTLAAPAPANAAGPLTPFPMIEALTFRPAGPTVAVATDRLPPGTAVVYASYFAWYAMHSTETTWPASLH